MIGTIRKHQRWLWVFIITATIISFVGYFSPNSSRAGRPKRGEAVVGTLDGQPVGQSHATDIYRQAELSGFLRFGENYRSPQARRQGFNLKQEFAQRLFLEARAKAYGIHVSDAAVATWISEYLRDPRTKVVNFDAFVQNSLRPAGFGENEFLDFVRHEIATQELERLIGVTGQLVTPQEAESEFRRANETIGVTLAYFPASNYLAGVTIDDAAIGAFFTNRIAQYRIPERITLSYIRFDLTNFFAAAQVKAAAIPDLTNQLEKVYLQRGADSFRDAGNSPLSKEAALAQIQDGLVRQTAAQLAGEKARDFANELYQITPSAPANLATLAQKHGLTLQQTPPFAEGERAVGLEDIRELNQALAQLSPEQPFTTPLEGARGVAVAAINGRSQSVIPPLETVRVKVEGDLREVRSVDAARAAGQAFHAAATNAVAAGKTFGDTAAAPQARVTDLSFTLSSPAIAGLDTRLNPAQVKNAVVNLQGANVTEFIPTGDGGFVVYVRERKPVDEAMAKAGLNSFLTEVRQEREKDAFNVWFAEQFAKSGAGEIAEHVDFEMKPAVPVIKLSCPATQEFWPVPVLFEDADLLALNKPARLLVSPDRYDPKRPNLMRLLLDGIAAGKPWATERGLTYLANAHRLDFETTGVLLLAKTRPALVTLANHFGSEIPRKTYVALVQGSPREDAFTVEAPLAPDRFYPGMMRVTRGGKKSVTDFTVRERFAGCALVEAHPHTGRTHQIRIHLKHAGHPVYADRVYGGSQLRLSSLKSRFHLKPGDYERPLLSTLALHAWRLELPHPANGQLTLITASWPKDLEVALKYLRRYATRTG